jgi:hypothetical protein
MQGQLLLGRDGEQAGQGQGGGLQRVAEGDETFVGGGVGRVADDTGGGAPEETG